MPRADALVSIVPGRPELGAAGVLGLLAYPLEPQAAQEFMWSAIVELLLERAASDPEWAWRQQPLEPALLRLASRFVKGAEGRRLNKTEQVVERGWSVIIRERLPAARMADEVLLQWVNKSGVWHPGISVRLIGENGKQLAEQKIVGRGRLRFIDQDGKPPSRAKVARNFYRPMSPCSEPESVKRRGQRARKGSWPVVHLACAFLDQFAGQDLDYNEVLTSLKVEELLRAAETVRQLLCASGLVRDGEHETLRVLPRKLDPTRPSLVAEGQAGT